MGALVVPWLSRLLPRVRIYAPLIASASCWPRQWDGPARSRLKDQMKSASWPSRTSSGGGGIGRDMVTGVRLPANWTIRIILNAAARALRPASSTRRDLPRLRKPSHGVLRLAYEQCSAEAALRLDDPLDPDVALALRAIVEQHRAKRTLPVAATRPSPRWSRSGCSRGIAGGRRAPPVSERSASSPQRSRETLYDARTLQVRLTGRSDTGAAEQALVDILDGFDRALHAHL